MLSGKCGCGAVRVEIPYAPKAVSACSCDACQRHAALWASYRRRDVRVVGHPARTVAYCQDDETVQFVVCVECGTATHWEAIEGDLDRLCGVNVRNFDASALALVRGRLPDNPTTPGIGRRAVRPTPRSTGTFASFFAFGLLLFRKG